ncbi:MAG: ATP-dependent sacrificial sulfur transferase LarE [Candidatus Bathyarchaeia archaeon]
MDESRSTYLKGKVDEVTSWIRSKGSIIVAFSGGVDSSLMALLARRALGDKAIAVTTDSATVPPGELEDAKRIAAEIGIRHIVTKVNELDNPDFAQNPANRCYFCKKELSTHLKELASQYSVSTIVTGVIADDLNGHRPGTLALEEQGIFNPLSDAGLTKQDVRDICRMFGLSTAEKPAMACLSSRVAYGEEITLEKLKRIGEAENFIKQRLGVRQLRVRVHGDLARIEVAPEERKTFFDEKALDEVYLNLRQLGFLYVTLDVGGYRSGSMDLPLKHKQQREVNSLIVLTQRDD